MKRIIAFSIIALTVLASCVKEQKVEVLPDFVTDKEVYGINEPVKITNMTEENVIETTLRPRAEVMVKSRLALEKIAADNNLSASDEAVESQYEAMATAYKMEIEKLKEIIKRDYIEKDCLAEAAMDFVKSKAVVKDAE